MLQFLSTKLFILDAINEKETLVENTHFQLEKSTLPTTIYVNPRILVEIIGGNLDTKHGLVNGVDGVFQLYTSQHDDIRWIEFNDTIIGNCDDKKCKAYTQVVFYFHGFQ